jgi:uncharacterized protein (TIGR02453 family)
MEAVVAARRRSGQDRPMGFFTQDTLDFWRGLAADNSKAYFDAHRRAYEEHLKEPYRALAAALVAGLQADQPEYQTDPTKAIYRINRDVRFSHDKSPYKTQLGITIGRREKHDSGYPGYTCRVGINGVAVAGGLYMPDTALRDQVRRYVGEYSTELRALTEAPQFASTYGALTGDAHKRAPAELKELAENEPLVLNKQWVFWADFEDPELLLDPELDQFILDHWAVAAPVMQFLKRAVTAE